MVEAYQLPRYSPSPLRARPLARGRADLSPWQQSGIVRNSIACNPLAVGVGGCGAPEWIVRNGFGIETLARGRAVRQLVARQPLACGGIERQPFGIETLGRHRVARGRAVRQPLARHRLASELIASEGIGPQGIGRQAIGRQKLPD